jgi:hypothetical protein
MSFQREEKDNEILIFILDESYDNGASYVRPSEREDKVDLEYEASRIYLRSIKAEFGVEFEEVNIAPNADLPAFVTALSNHIVPLSLLAVFFSGEKIVKNIDAWLDMFRRLKQYFSRPILLNRNGAAVIAIKAVFDHMDQQVTTLRLVSYKITYIGEEPTDGAEKVEEAPPTIELFTVKHIFKIEADGIRFLVKVDGHRAKVQML